MKVFIATISVLMVFVAMVIGTAQSQQGVSNFTVTVELLDFRSPPMCDTRDCYYRFQFCLRPQSADTGDLTCPQGNLEDVLVRVDGESDNSGSRNRNQDAIELPAAFTFSGLTQRNLQLLTSVLENNPRRSLLNSFPINFELFQGALDNAEQGDLVVDITVTCAENYYGEFCDMFCVPRNDSGVHYMCDREMGVVCLPGYKDPLTYCNTTCPGGICVTDNESSSAFAPVVGGVVSVLLFVVIAITIGLVTVLVARRKSRQHNERKLAGVSQLNSTLIRGSTNNSPTKHNQRDMVLGARDNPTYGGDVSPIVTQLDPSRPAQPDRVHRSRSNGSRTTSHKYEYINYIVSVPGDDNQSTQSTTEVSQMDSGAYSYIDERTVRRLLSTETVGGDDSSQMPSGHVQSTAAVVIPVHYETMDVCIPDTVGDISARYETMADCVLSDAELQDSTLDNEFNVDVSNHYEFDSA